MFHCYVFQCQAFRKINLKDQYHLLIHIHRNKTIHNHSIGIMQDGNEDGNDDGVSACNKIMSQGELRKETRSIATLGFVSGKEGSFISYSSSEKSISGTKLCLFSYINMLPGVPLRLTTGLV